MATYRNLLYWLLPPDFEFQDGDIVYGGNLAQTTCKLIDQGKKVRFIGCNLGNCETTLEQLPEDKNNQKFYSIEETIEQPILDVELASLAEVVKSALLSTGTLTQEQIAGLTYLCDTTKQVAGNNPTLGEAATNNTLKIIQLLEQYNKPELAEQMRQMLTMVQQSGVIQ
jgi:hypothetical protein